MDDRQTQSGASGGPLSAEAIDAWIEAAQPGAQLLYHSGNFAVAVGQGDVLDRRLDALRSALQAEEARGMLQLVQRKRRGVDARAVPGFDYVAVRSSRPTPKAGEAERRPRIVRTMADQAVAEISRMGGRSGR